MQPGRPPLWAAAMSRRKPAGRCLPGAGWPGAAPGACLACLQRALVASYHCAVAGSPQVNLALRGLPTFACLPEDRGQHRTTTHLLPGGEGEVLANVQRAFAQAQAGQLPDFPTVEIYWQTTVDPTLTGKHRGRRRAQPWQGGGPTRALHVYGPSGSALGRPGRVPRQPVLPAWAC